MSDDLRRTHHCGELSDKNIGETVTLCGWVHTRRDHGGLIFIDLWDKHDITQVVLNPQIDRLAHQHAQSLRGNFVIGVTGKVRARPEGMVNALSLIAPGGRRRGTRLVILSTVSLTLSIFFCTESTPGC